jgi:trk system potassium uptake protein TrkA
VAHLEWVPVKIFILGCGRVGSRLAQELDRDGHDVTIVDSNPDAFSRSASRGVFSESFRGNFVVGDGTEADLLRRAGIEEADCFVAVTQGDNRNIMAAQIAREVFKVKRVITRIYDPMRENAYREFGLNTICPTLAGAHQIHAMLRA